MAERVASAGSLDAIIAEMREWATNGPWVASFAHQAILLSGWADRLAALQASQEPSDFTALLEHHRATERQLERLALCTNQTILCSSCSAAIPKSRPKGKTCGKPECQVHRQRQMLAQSKARKLQAAREGDGR